MKRIKFIVATLIMTLIFSISSNAQEKYAVLVCGNIPYYVPPGGSWAQANPPEDNNDLDEFWNDIYLYWKMLIENGYKNENIFVLFNGESVQDKDWSADFSHDVSKQYNPRKQYQPIIQDGNITDYAATESNLNMLLEGMATGNISGITQLTEDDFLFVWTFGDGENLGNNSSRLLLMQGSITDQEFYNKIQDINCDKKVLLFQQCFSGSFANKFANETDVYALSAASPSMEAHSVDKWFFDGIDYPGDPNPGTQYNAYEEDIWLTPSGENHEHTHGEFSLHIYNAFMGETPAESNEYEITGYSNPVLSEADVNNDNIISIDEADEWMMTYNSRFYSTSGMSYDDPQLNDPGNMGSTTSLKYPTIIHSNVSVSKTENGIIGIPVDVHILEGTTLTFSGAAVYLDYYGDLYVDEGATLIIDDNVAVKSVNGLRKIIVNGEIQIGNAVSFIAEGDAQLQLKINNTDVDITFANCTFSSAGMFLYNNSTTITNSEFSSSGIYGFNGNFDISGSSFFNSFIEIKNASDINKHVNITNQCNFNSLNIDYAVEIDNYPNFNISNNSILNCYSGIYILNSGYGKYDYLISGNTVSNSIAYGITLYNSTVELNDNTVEQNNIGL